MLGIMQGRLSPPVDGQLQAFQKDWQKEFYIAARLGLKSIEWVYDSTANPLLTRNGTEEIYGLGLETGVIVKSVCADFFVKYPIFKHPDGAIVHLVYLIEQCHQAHINKIVIPLVDNSALQPMYWDTAIEVLGKAIPYSYQYGIQLLIETSLPPHKVYEFLNLFPEHDLYICYDTGNSASLGYRTVEEFSWFGDYIKHIHIKDRLSDEKYSVPLGNGAVDFKRFFPLIKSYGYDGDMILQVARGESGMEEEWTRQNVEFVNGYLGSNL